MEKRSIDFTRFDKPNGTPFDFKSIERKVSINFINFGNIEMKKLFYVLFLLILSITTAFAYCDNTSMTGYYLQTYTGYINAPGVFGSGTYYFDGKSNVHFYGSNEGYGTFYYQGTENGWPITGGGNYLMDSTCHLSAMMHFTTSNGTNKPMMMNPWNAFTKTPSGMAYTADEALIGVNYTLWAKLKRK